MTHSRTPFKKILKQILMEIGGSILIAAAVYNFAVQAGFPMTGFSGISIILYRLFQIPIGLSTVLLNVPVAILCYRLLGRQFLLRSLGTLFISSFLIDYAAPFFPVYKGDRLLAALCTGVIGGLGYAIIYMQNSSTGGMDFIILAIKSLHPHLSLGRIIFWADVGIVAVGGILFRDIDGIIYGLIVSYLYSLAVDKLMYGVNAGKLALIVTQHGRKICGAIDACCGRGSTILHGRGGYQGAYRQVVLCALSNREMYLVQRALKDADPEAFLIILESNEVHGQGFQMLRVGEQTK